jgi:hypothetical protein
VMTPSSGLVEFCRLGVHCVEVSDVVKTVNYINYELSGEHWLAGSDVRVTWGDLGINTTSLLADLATLSRKSQNGPKE